jgi:signal transduction histidine kinase
MIPTLFEPFRRGRGAGKGTGGVGLGLHIVSEIARAHGGTVEAKSDANSTVFLVTLPVAAPSVSAAV